MTVWASSAAGAASTASAAAAMNSPERRRPVGFRRGCTSLDGPDVVSAGEKEAARGGLRGCVRVARRVYFTSMIVSFSSSSSPGFFFSFLLGSYGSVLVGSAGPFFGPSVLATFVSLGFLLSLGSGCLA